MKDKVFAEVNLNERNHVLTWFTEVLTADFFHPESMTHQKVIDLFIQQYDLGKNKNWDEDFTLVIDYEEFQEHNDSNVGLFDTLLVELHAT